MVRSGPTSPDDATRPDSLGDSRRDHLRVLALWEGGAQVAWLARDAVLSIGRALGSGIVIDHPSVSRNHAEIIGTIPPMIRDLGSSNGIRVRGARITPEVPEPLRPGDVIQLGSAVIIVQEPVDQPGSTDEADAGDDDPMTAIDRLIELVSRGDISVLLLGETGVGKGVAAERIHRSSARANGPFTCVNCAALPEPLLEGELFGYERGAFSGAVRAKPGLFEAAQGGTVFLDEIGEMAMSTQVKLLSVLDNNQVQRLGSVRASRIDVRWIAATNRSLEAAVRGGSFRADLFYRLSGVRIVIPPLRSRPRAVLELARKFLSEMRGTRALRLSDEASAWLVRQPWPGNVRQLKLSIERACLLAEGDVIAVRHLEMSNAGEIAEASLEPHRGATESAEPEKRPSLRAEIEDLERRRIREALAVTRGNQTEAAKLLGISRRALISRIEEFRLPRPRKG